MGSIPSTASVASNAIIGEVEGIAQHYTVNSRSVWAVRNPVLKKKKNQPQKCLELLFPLLGGRYDFRLTTYLRLMLNLHFCHLQKLGLLAVYRILYTGM